MLGGGVHGVSICRGFANEVFFVLCAPGAVPVVCVVVANKQGVRYSHPNPALIGQRLTDGAIPLSGRTWVGVQGGSLGRSMRAKVPLRDEFGDVIGLVSVGMTEKTLSAQLLSNLPVILIPSLLGLLLGAVGSVLLARRIKRQTFGL